jgi:transcription antitermination factor NusG
MGYKNVLHTYPFNVCNMCAQTVRGTRCTHRFHRLPFLGLLDATQGRRCTVCIPPFFLCTLPWFFRCNAMRCILASLQLLRNRACQAVAAGVQPPTSCKSDGSFQNGRCIGEIFEACQGSMAWMVVRTKSHEEQRAQFHLERRGCETYLPIIRNRSKKTEPLFPRYLFVEPPEEFWWFLRSTIGVLSLVMRGSFPDIMPDKTMEQLRATEDENGFIKLDSLSLLLTPGCEVRCVAGPMSGHSGVFLGKSKNDRCAVLFRLLGCECKTDVALENLQLA